MVLPLQVRIGLIQCYYECNRHYANALRRFRTLHGLRNGPCLVKSFRKLVQKFEETGSVTDKKRMGRPKLVENEVSAALVLQEVQEVSANSAHNVCSANNVAKRLDMSYSTVWRILRRQLKLYPYKLKMLFELKQQDKNFRVTFALQVLAEIQNNVQWLDKIFWTDEAHFELNGGVNTHNCRIWAETDPNEIVQQPLHDTKVTVWCGFTSNFIIGPYFYEEMADGQIKTVTVNGQRYLRMLNEFVVPELQNHDIENIVFMQDGAPPHIHNPVKTLLRNTFGDRVISRHFPNTWPSRSPDINPADYWLWGYLKERVFLNRPTTREELKQSISHVIENIPLDALYNAVHNIEERLYVIEQNGGGHI